MPICKKESASHASYTDLDSKGVMSPLKTPMLVEESPLSFGDVSSIDLKDLRFPFHEYPKYFPTFPDGTTPSTSHTGRLSVPLGLFASTTFNLRFDFK